MNVFYKTNIEGNNVILDSKESLHCIKVMRYKIGDLVKIIDGRGGYYEAKIVNDNYKACQIEIIDRKFEFEALPYELNLAIAPTKSMDRFEWFVEKATEIGISSITPIICSHSERRSIRIDRIEKLVISAMKQSLKAYLPKINHEVDYETWIKNTFSGDKYIAHCMEGERIDIRNISFSNSITILIGPEGDFTPEELNCAIKTGFRPVSLGKYRLRTETAGLVACTAVSMKFGS